MPRTQFIHHVNDGVAGISANALKVRAFFLQALRLPWGGAAARGIEMAQDPRRREEVAELLPWYAAGTLDPADRAAVEQALAGDAALAARLHAIRAELAEIVHENESLGGPSGRARQKLFAAIEAERGSRPPGGRTVRSLRMVWLGLIGSIAVLGGWLMARRPRTPGS